MHLTGKMDYKCDPWTMTCISIDSSCDSVRNVTETCGQSQKKSKKKIIYIKNKQIKKRPVR